MRFHLVALLLLFSLNRSQAQELPAPDPPAPIQWSDLSLNYDAPEVWTGESLPIIDSLNWTALPLESCEPPIILSGEGRTALTLEYQSLALPYNSDRLFVTPPAAIFDDDLTDEARILFDKLNEIPADKPLSIAIYLDRIQNLQDAYTRLDKLDEAEAVREKLDEYKAPQTKAKSNPGNLTTFRGQVGKSLLFTVRGAAVGPIYGNKIYTDDSDLDIVAVHAGALRVGQDGLVRVTILGGQEHYDSVERNGVTSRPYKKWEGSYRVEVVKPSSARPQVDALPQAAKDVLGRLRGTLPTAWEEEQIRDGMNALRNIEIACAGNTQLDAALACRDARLYFVGGRLGALPDPGLLTAYRNKTGQSFYFYTQGHPTNALWGDGVYTDDSSLSAVALHAGALRRGQRGLVKVTILPGRESYDGAERNGAFSHLYSSWTGSYRIESVPF